ncbi:MAG: hypothetical protein ACXVCO_13720 [Ktedonobacterales bacterium]
MLDYLKGAWARFEVHWHGVAVAFVTAVPVLLDQLGVIDIKPILIHFMSPEMASAVVGLMPFALAFLKPLFKVAPHPDDTEQTG